MADTDIRSLAGIKCFHDKTVHSINLFGSVIFIEQELLVETLTKLCCFSLIKEKVMQVQIAEMLQYCRCSFSGRIRQSRVTSDISSHWLFEGSKIPCQCTC